MPGQRIGSVIAAVFGLVYVAVNAGQLPAPASWALRAAALVVFAGVLLLVAAGRHRRAGAPGDGRGQAGPGRAPFGRRYWLIVLVEFAAIFAGARTLSGPLDRPDAGVAWVTFVVGTHFFVLAAHFGARFFHVLAAALTMCGVVSLVIAFTASAAAVVALVGGVVPGLVLLGFAAWGAGHGAWQGRVPQQRPHSQAATPRASRSS